MATDTEQKTTSESPPAKQQATLSGEPLRDAAGPAAEAGEMTGTQAVKQAAAGRKLDPQGASKALDWFLSATPTENELETKVLQLNFGTTKAPEWIFWKITSVGINVMRQIRQRATNSRAARRSGNVDEYRVNLEVVVAGTVDPNLTEATRILAEEGRGPNNPAENLRLRFQSKPGYIAQIAGEIMSLSGFDDDDVQEAEQVKAAGNS